MSSTSATPTFSYPAHLVVALAGTLLLRGQSIGGLMVITD